MKIVLVTGSAGLIDSESMGFFGGQGYKIIGIGNNICSFFQRRCLNKLKRDRFIAQYQDPYIYHSVEILK